jgi:hypothetical protein
MKTIIKLMISFIVGLLLANPACAQQTKFEQFTELNAQVRQLYNENKIHLITAKVDSSDYFNKWKHRHFLYNGNFLDWKYDEVLLSYKLIGEAYVRDQQPEKAKLFVKRMLILEPEYLHHNPTDLKYLLRRFIALKFTIGVNGIAAFILPQIKNQSMYQPDGGTSSSKVGYGQGLKSSFFGGVELLQNPALKSPIHSIDFYLEYMFHSDRIYHRQTTTYQSIPGYPSEIVNKVTERQDWQSLLLYPRLSVNTSNDQWTVFFLAGIGLNWLKADEFFEIHQQIDRNEFVELSPVKLYKKEKMRMGENISVIGGIGMNYTASRNITFYFSARYMSMMNNLTTNYSLTNKPLQGAPLYYTDKDLYINQLSFVGGVAANIGACPRWLGF